MAAFFFAQDIIEPGEKTIPDHSVPTIIPYLEENISCRIIMDTNEKGCTKKEQPF